VAKKKGTVGRPGFGSFLARLAADPSQRQTLPEATPTPEGDADMMGAWRRASLPKKVAALEKDIAAMKRASTLKAPKQKRAPRGGCDLNRLVAVAKASFPAKAAGKGSHLFLAHAVDKMLAKKGLELKDVCPKSWLNVNNLPRLFSDALTHPELKPRTKVVISKA